MTPLRCGSSPSAARSFVQIASRSYSTTSALPASALSLEFLAPRAASAAKTRPFSGLTRLPRSSAHSLTRRCFEPMGLESSQRSFTTSTGRQATVCVQNPLKDEDGNEMVLEITARAAKRLGEIMAKDQNPNLALRITVESGGCHGFQYLMSLITIPAKDAEEWSSIISEEDTIFQYVPDDAPGASHTATLVLDEPSLELLKGSKVDFKSELIGSSFQIVDNPHASSSCGCGTSFDIKI